MGFPAAPTLNDVSVNLFFFLFFKKYKVLHQTAFDRIKSVGCPGCVEVFRKYVVIFENRERSPPKIKMWILHICLEHKCNFILPEEPDTRNR